MRRFDERAFELSVSRVQLAEGSGWCRWCGQGYGSYCESMDCDADQCWTVRPLPPGKHRIGVLVLMNSVLTALRVFEQVATAQPIGLSELARRLGTPKATVQRNLKTLHEAGWIRPATGDSRWEITSLAFRLGSAVATKDNLRDMIMPELAFLQSVTGETIHLAVPDGDELVLVERLDSAHQLRAFLALGTRLPLHAAATGKAYLATLGDAAIEAYLSTRLSKVTVSTITDPGQVREEIQIIRQRGYATTTDAFNEGISAVAVAVRGSSGPAHACFSISGPSSRLTADRLIDYAGLALKARAAIEKSLGHCR
ncbi:IclR family transcriptional regulator [Mycolicibacter icosiumassiliensis]|uniref:IclR family transcriptional regulator n=1 Tax=Mycolicibacter icosiumassiliensis TaxID=1792835 RepID=UPI001F3BDE9B|nr:IclR family transcriptional regulator [Mycolicibacter icosiumassiliensis]